MLELKAENRTIFGKNLKVSRKEGKLPAILYGPKEKSHPIFISLKDFKKIWQEVGESTVIQLNLGNSKKEVLIQEVAVDPVKDEPIHVDFYAALMDKPIEAAVELVFEGIPPAVKNLGGVLVKVMREIKIEALPRDLPQELIVDISDLVNLGDKKFAKEIALPRNVRLISNPDDIVALVEAPKEEEVALAEEKIAFEEIKVAGKKEKEKEEEETQKEEQK